MLTDVRCEYIAYFGDHPEVNLMVWDGLGSSEHENNVRMHSETRDETLKAKIKVENLAREGEMARVLVVVLILVISCVAVALNGSKFGRKGKLLSQDLGGSASAHRRQCVTRIGAVVVCGCARWKPNVAFSLCANFYLSVVSGTRSNAVKYFEEGCSR